ncbi:MAG: translation elongation factor Ts [Gammaproteobacteria bacterium]|jgi:elongation factor Ts
MAIKPAMVKELRERTGAGMMDCKKALVESDGDLEAAAELLRKAGQAKADKKSGRVAAEGQVLVKSDKGRHVVVEVNSETDFVANDENFRQFADVVADAALSSLPGSVDELMSAKTNGQSVEEARQALITKVGENIAVRRFEILESNGTVGAYTHMGRIGVVVEMDGGDEALARDIAMHIAATAPQCVSRDDIPADQIDKEREILSAQALQEGKPANIVEKMVEGRLRKFFDEVTLLGQPFVRNPDQTVGDLLRERKAGVRGFIRYAVGEGVDRSAAEVD